MKKQHCSECNGHGRIDNPRDLYGTETCGNCAGTGHIEWRYCEIPACPLPGVERLPNGEWLCAEHRDAVQP